MKVQKFLAGSTREALKSVRETLGADAIILSNRQIGDRIEILATSEREIGSLKLDPPEVEAPTATLESMLRQPPYREALAPEISFHSAESSEVMGMNAFPYADMREKQAAGVKNAEMLVDLNSPSVAFNTQMAGLLREMKAMHGTMAAQLANLSWDQMAREEPSKVELLRVLLAAGFSPVLCREIAHRLPGDMDYDQRLALAKKVLARNLRVVGTDDDLVKRGGIYALIGPTGVGKTTTIAKIAARCSLLMGPDSVALLTTDNYRIGAHEQLRIYAKILGAPAYSVKDETDLQGRLEELGERHLVLIDTAGMSQRDKRLIHQAQILAKGSREVHRLLLLNATSLGPTLDDVVSAFTRDGLEGCVLTKVDESVRLAAALDVVIRQRLKLYYIADGQRVPEDLHLADAKQLIEQALEMPVPAPFHLHEMEFPLMMANVGDPSV